MSIAIKRGVMAGVLAIAMITILSGCSLAKEDAGEEKKQDRLVGVFITTESISTFDEEAFFEEHVMDFTDGDTEIEVEASEERVYATIEKHGSSEPEDWEIRFGNFEGMNFFDVLFETEDEEPFTMLWCDGVCDPYTGYHSTDEGENVELKGNVYVPITKEEVIFYNNPVYQTPEGDLYAVSAMGNCFGNTGSGISMTETLKGEITKTENGKTISEKSEIAITYKCAYEPKQILVHQMDENHHLVKTDTYKPGTLPEEMTTEPATEYLVIETEWNNPEKKEDITREICEKDGLESEYFETMYKGDGFFMEKMTTYVIWGK